MHKRDYFIQGLKAGAYRHKAWVIDIFSITKPNNEAQLESNIPFPLLQSDDGLYGFMDPTNGVLVGLEGAKNDEPLFMFNEEFVINAGEIENCDKPRTTTYGIALINQICLAYPFGSKIPYVDGEISPSQLEALVEKRLVNIEDLDKKADNVSVDEYLRFCEGTFALAGFSQLCVPSMTPRSLTTDPRIPALRAELIEKYKKQLNDPVIQAKIGNELIAMDKAWLKGDPSEGFYIKSKSFDVVRKKMFLMQGAEQGFDVQGELIPASLSEGWEIKNLPAISNALRDGSYSRGALTALGGEATKFNYRIFQNSSISEDDCGSKLGLPYLLTKDNIKSFISNSYVLNGKVIEITDENAGSLLDQTVFVRSPAYCQTEGVNFCATCMGKKLSVMPNAIGTMAADIGSIFMGLMLKAMHGKSLQVVEFDTNIFS